MPPALRTFVTRFRTLCMLGGIASVSPVALHAQGQVVGPGGGVVLGSGSNWIPWTQGGGLAEVTTDRPRLGWGDVGLGSLRLSVTGQLIGGQYPDWAFWYHYAGGTAETSLANLGNGGSFGLLSELSGLSFDWFRVAFPGWDTPCPDGQQPMPPCDWRYKTPVLRLELAEQIGDVLVRTELIWEGYFNQATLGGLTPVDQWVTSSDLQNGNFWYVRPAVGAEQGYTTIGSGLCDLEPFTFWQGNVEANAITQLLGSGGCIGANAQVIGIAVGVGSQWPIEYVGYVDNVRLQFNGQTALDANFDYIVPEPSTYLLVGAGLLAMGAVSARRRRRGNQAGLGWRSNSGRTALQGLE